MEKEKEIIATGNNMSIRQEVLNSIILASVFNCLEKTSYEILNDKKLNKLIDKLDDYIRREYVQSIQSNIRPRQKDRRPTKTKGKLSKSTTTATYKHI